MNRPNLQARPTLRARAAPLLLALALLLPSGAIGRPGGGESYSGSSDSSSGGSSGSYDHSFGGESFGGSGASSGGGGIFGVLVFALIVATAVISLVHDLKKEARGDGGSPEPARQRFGGARRELARLRDTLDPEFSLVLFQDFLYALFIEAHHARARGARMDELAPYLSEHVRQALGAGARPDEVKGVIVGALQIEAARGLEAESAQVAVKVTFESNYTDVLAGRDATVFAVERWSLVRGKQARSRPPEKVRAFTCPSCGAPLSALRGNTCSSCQRAVDTGEFDWLVTDIEVLRLEPRGALFSQGGVEEVGTDWPTVIDRDVDARLQALRKRDPSFDWFRFEARVRLVFGELQEAWSNRAWARARPYVSDRLFQSLSWWMEAYEGDRLRNVTEGGQVSRIELCRVESDRWYDALTVRVHANSLDYTIGDDGRLRAGSRKRRRAYTEYWTLIRGAQVKRAASADKRCPKCGASLKIDMAGSCEYCQARVTSGEFDWVLSMIEQDEAYQG